MCRKSGRRSAGSLTVAAAKSKYDYDLVIIGCGVGGHGAALHAVESVSSFYAHCIICPPQSLLLNLLTVPTIRSLQEEAVLVCQQTGQHVLRVTAGSQDSCDRGP